MVVGSGSVKPLGGLIFQGFVVNMICGLKLALVVASFGKCNEFAIQSVAVRQKAGSRHLHAELAEANSLVQCLSLRSVSQDVSQVEIEILCHLKFLPTPNSNQEILKYWGRANLPSKERKR